MENGASKRRRGVGINSGGLAVVFGLKKAVKKERF